MTNATSNPRPYWQVDLKWISGLLLVFVLQVVLFVNCMVMITSEKVALDVMSKGLASVYRLEKGLDHVTEINELKRALKASPSGSIIPIPELPIILKEQDIAALSSEIRINIFRQVAEHIYYGEMEKYLTTDAKSEKILAGTEFRIFTFITKDNHEKLVKILLILIGMSLGLVIPLICFSHRFGRIASPGFVLMTSCLPGMVFFNLCKMILSKGNASPPTGINECPATLIGYIASITLPPILEEILKIYGAMMVTGFFIVFIAFLRRIFFGLKSQSE